MVRAAALLPAGRGAVVGCGAIGRLFSPRCCARAATASVSLDPDAARLVAAADEGFEPAATDEQLDFAVVTAPGGAGRGARAAAARRHLPALRAPAAPRAVLLDPIYRRELVLVGSRSATPASLRAALELIASKQVAVEDLVTDVLPLAEFAEGLERYRRRSALKVVFRP